MIGEALSDGSTRTPRYNRRSRQREEAPTPPASEPNSEAPTRVPSGASTSSTSSADSRSARPWRLRGSVVGSPYTKDCPCLPLPYWFCLASIHIALPQQNPLPAHQKHFHPPSRIFALNRSCSVSPYFPQTTQEALPDDRVEAQLERIRQTARSTVASRMITCAELVDHIKCVPKFALCKASCLLNSGLTDSRLAGASCSLWKLLIPRKMRFVTTC
jgi:hypothetical protein